MPESERGLAAKQFSEYWEDKGYEKGETQSFGLSLLRDIFAVKHPEQFISFEDKVELDYTSFMDGYISATKVLIEQKSSDKDLNKPIKQSDGALLTPFQQAKRYRAELPYSKQPRWVVISNFQKFCVYDTEQPQFTDVVCDLLLRKASVDFDWSEISPTILVDAENIFIENIKKPICSVPEMITGNRPADGGNLIIEEEDYGEFIKKEPKAAKYIKKITGAKEFINNESRYCLWLVGINPKE